MDVVGDESGNATSKSLREVFPAVSSASLVMLSVVLFVIGTAMALWQYSRPYYWHEPHDLTGWFWQPWEWNVDSALPQVPRNLHAVAQSPNGRCLWIAGDSGFLAYSSDRGRNWNELRYERSADGQNATFHAPAGTFPCASNAAQVADKIGFSLVTPAYASEKPPANAQQVNAPVGAQTNSSSRLPNTAVSPRQQAPTIVPSPQQKAAPVQQQQQKSPTNGNEQTPNQTAQSKADLSGNVAPAIVIDPATVDFGKAQIGVGSSRTISITNIGNRSVEIGPPYFVDQGSKAAEPKSPYLPASWSCATIEVSKRCLVEIDFHPTVAGLTKWLMVLDVGPKKYPITLVADAWKLDASKAGPVTPVQSGGSTSNNGAPAKAPGGSAPTPVAPEQTVLWSFSFSSDTAGTILTGDLSTFKTNDGGQTWTWSPAASKPDLGLEDKILTSPVSGASELPSKSLVSSRALRWDPKDHRFKIRDEGSSRMWLPYASDLRTDAYINAMYFVGEKGWALDLERVQYSSDEGKHWTEISRLPAKANADSIYVNKNGRDLWVAGARGELFHSPDGGHAWWPLTREAAAMLVGHPAADVTAKKFYGRLVAPWYFTLVVFCGVLLVPAFQERRAKKKAETPEQDQPATKPNRQIDDSIIGTQGVSDKPLEPGEPDALELGKIAAGLSFFLRNKKTKPPLVISVNGRWGSGKSSLMNLLRKKLESGGAHPVWFNAWHHQKEEQLLAALLQAVKQQAVPPVFALHGLRFRWNLLWKRLQQHWSYIGVAIAIVYLVFRAETFLRNTLHPPVDIGKLLSYLSRADFTGLSQDGTLGWITGLIAAYQILSRLLTAFGSKPEALLTSVSGSTKNKDLEAQTSFRMRFAREFQDVTTALPTDQRMLILIDDLDRCRPEKVREVFEAVNFLVSSGDCFVVLGMARDIVEHYVGLSFRNVVDGLSWEALGLTEEDKARAFAKVDMTSTHGAQQRRRSDDTEVFARRWAFARLYLDKLVQIEITIPEPSTAQKRALFEIEESRRKKEDQKEQAFQKTLRRLEKLGRVLRPALQVVVVAIVVIGLGYAVSRNLADVATSANDRIEKAEAQKKQDDDELKKRTQKSMENMTAIATGLAQIAGNLEWAGTRAKSTKAVTSNESAGVTSGKESAQVKGAGAVAQQNVTPTPPTVTGPLGSANISRQNGWLGTWPFLVMLIAAVGVFSVALQVTPEQNAQDSAKFTNALSAWFPLVMTSGAKNTPRAAKRFQNRVRYLAMRQRALNLGDQVPLGERWLRERMGVPAAPVASLPSIGVELNEAEYKEVEQARTIVESGVKGETASWILEPAQLPKPKLPSAKLTPLQFAACVTGRVHIPESLLVAFAAIEEFQPSWMREDREFGWISDLDLDSLAKTKALPIAQRDYLLFREAKESAGWSNWYNLPLYRYAYLRLCSEVGRQDAVAALAAKGGR